MSTDESVAAIKRATHARMRLISEPDGGIYDALNKGIQHATGDVIGFMHSDDFFAHDDVLAKVAAAFEDSTVESVYGDLDYIAKTDKTKVLRHWLPGTFEPQRLKYGWMPPHPALYLSSEVYERFGTYDINFSIAADYDFILRYFTQTSGKAVYVPEVLYKMRVGGISNRSFATILKKMQEDLLALRRNQVGGLPSLAMKSLSKAGQVLSLPKGGSW